MVLTSSAKETEDSQPCPSSEEQIAEITQQSLIEKFSIQTSQTVSENETSQRLSRENTAVDINFLLPETWKEREETLDGTAQRRPDKQQDTSCDLFLAELLTQKGSFSSREKRSLSLIAEHSRDSESSGNRNQSSLNSTVGSRREDKMYYCKDQI